MSLNSGDSEEFVGLGRRFLVAELQPNAHRQRAVPARWVPLRLPTKCHHSAAFCWPGEAIQPQFLQASKETTVHANLPRGGGDLYISASCPTGTRREDFVSTISFAARPKLS